MTAETVFHNGRIWTGAIDDPIIEALAVTGSRISGLGQDALDQIGASTEVIDLAGGMLLPGFGDGHMHPDMAGSELTGVPVTGATTVAEAVALVAQFAEDHPDAEWITGGSYVPSLRSDGKLLAEWLDEVVPDRPVALYAADHHTLWVNSEALRRAGITSQTPDPDGGLIVRHEDGRPLGILAESAMDLVKNVIPRKSTEELASDLAAAARVMADAGITWAQSAGADPDQIAAYVQCVEDGRFPVRMNVALWTSPTDWRDQVGPFTELRESTVKNDMFGLTSAKFWGDGAITSVDNPTAAVLEPYEGTCSHGIALWDPEELKLATAAFDAAGWQLHIHGVGDRAVRAALDAIEHVDAVNGPADRRPVVAHVILAQPEDVERFEALGAIPCMTPVWAMASDWTTDIIIPPLGSHREKLLFPMGTLSQSSVPLSFGSDWPVTTIRPLEGISTAVTRQTPDGRPEGGWIPEQRMSLDAALHAYTSGPAYQAGREHEAGALRVGMLADLCQLGANLYEVEPLAIPSVPVRGTWIAGVRQ
jgi:predicted amidohydrolase YtcJ